MISIPQSHLWNHNEPIFANVIKKATIENHIGTQQPTSSQKKTCLWFLSLSLFLSVWFGLKLLNLYILYYTSRLRTRLCLLTTANQGLSQFKGLRFVAYATSFLKARQCIYRTLTQMPITVALKGYK